MDAELNAKEDNSAVAKLVAKIIDNIQISVNRVHIRFEDHSSIPGHPFAAGIILEKLHLHTPSDNGNEPEMIIPGVMRKKVRVTRLGVYWDFDNPSCIRTKSIETMQEEMKYPFIPLTEAVILTAASGALVPKATIVNPTINAGILNAFAILELPSTNQSAHFTSKTNPIIIRIKLI